MSTLICFRPKTVYLQESSFAFCAQQANVWRDFICIPDSMSGEIKSSEGTEFYYVYIQQFALLYPFRFILAQPLHIYFHCLLQNSHHMMCLSLSCSALRGNSITIPLPIIALLQDLISILDFLLSRNAWLMYEAMRIIQNNTVCPSAFSVNKKHQSNIGGCFFIHISNI